MEMDQLEHLTLSKHSIFLTENTVWFFVTLTLEVGRHQ